MSSSIPKNSLQPSLTRRHLLAVAVCFLLAGSLLLTSCQPAPDQDPKETTASEREDTSRTSEMPSSNETESETDLESITSLTTETETTEAETTESTLESETTTGAETTQTAAATTRTTTAAATTTRATTAAATTTQATTAAATTTQATTTATAEPAGSFPHKNFGAFFRDQYGSNSRVESQGGISVDTGSTAHGVVLVRVGSDAIAAGTRCKAAFMNSSNQVLYQYDIVVRDRYVGLPLNMGNGAYRLMILENVGGSDYTPKMTHEFSVSLASSLKPYTAANIFVDFSRGSAAVQRANSLTSGIGTTDGKVSAVYRWITQNITYDRALASNIQSGQINSHLPNPDQTMSSRKGICFDYASLMAAMLRSQGIPTRLSVGNTSYGYHAWNEVYFEGRGWVVVAEFRWQQVDGSAWVLFDSTFAAGGMSSQEIQNTSYSRDRVY